MATSTLKIQYGGDEPKDVAKFYARVHGLKYRVGKFSWKTETYPITFTGEIRDIDALVKTLKSFETPSVS